jgi:predicted nuclease with TOPRIM domain
MEPLMATCSETGAKEAKSYSSPWRVLARVFERSRDLWKAKYQELQERIKAFRTELRDLRRSRDRWRAKADALQRQVDELRAEMQRRTEQSPPALSRRSSQLQTRHLS